MKQLPDMPKPPSPPAAPMPLRPDATPFERARYLAAQESYNVALSLYEFESRAFQSAMYDYHHAVAQIQAQMQAQAATIAAPAQPIFSAPATLAQPASATPPQPVLAQQQPMQIAPPAPVTKSEPAPTKTAAFEGREYVVPADLNRVAILAASAQQAIAGGVDAGDLHWHGGPIPFTWATSAGEHVEMDHQTFLAFAKVLANA